MVVCVVVLVVLGEVYVFVFGWSQREVVRVIWRWSDGKREKVFGLFP